MARLPLGCLIVAVILFAACGATASAQGSSEWTGPANPNGEPGDQRIVYPPYTGDGRAPWMTAGPVGDVNGDGLEDVAAGVGSDVYVTFSTRVGGVDEAIGADGFRVEGFDQIVGLSSAGDVNRDGLEEVAIRTPGRVDVVFGRREIGIVTDCCSGAEGFSVIGTGPPSWGGGNGIVKNLPVVNLGDLSGDGVDDLLVDLDGGAAIIYPPRLAAGLTIDARTPGPFVSRIVAGGHPFRDTFVDSLGDVDGDGREDILVAGEVNDPSRSDQVAFGAKAPGPGVTLDLDVALDAGEAFVLRTHDGEAGWWGELERVLSLGDQNGDGKRDVGMVGHEDGLGKMRVAYSPAFGTDLDIDDLGAADSRGYSWRPYNDVVDVGDQNGDGRGDFASNSYVYFSDPSKETGTREAVHSGFYFSSNGWGGIVGPLRDLNGDGREEIVLARVDIADTGAGQTGEYMLDVYDSAVTPEVPLPELPELTPEDEVRVPIDLSTGAGTRGGRSLSLKPQLELATPGGEPVLARDVGYVPSGGARATLALSAPARSALGGRPLVPGGTYRARYVVANSRGLSATGPWRSFVFEGRSAAGGGGDPPAAPEPAAPSPAAPGAAGPAPAGPGTAGPAPAGPAAAAPAAPARGVSRRGTARADNLLGTRSADALTGLGGGDVLNGLGGDDRLDGGGGPDRLGGGAGRDSLSGGSGRDRIFPGPGADLVDAGAGNDFIDSRDGAKDRVRCGRGRDKIRADRRDSLIGCELRRR